MPYTEPCVLLLYSSAMLSVTSTLLCLLQYSRRDGGGLGYCISVFAFTLKKGYSCRCLTVKGVLTLIRLICDSAEKTLTFAFSVTKLIFNIMGIAITAAAT